MDYPELAYWLWLNNSTNLSLKNLHQLLELGQPKTIYEQPDLLEQIKLSPAAKQQLLKPNWAEIETSLKWAEDKDHHILCLADHDYPTLLKQIPDPPPVLFIKGDVSLLNELQIAMVGCRNMSPYGQAIAKHFASELAALGIIITSGMALGIDSVCHQSALNNDGKTIAVLGSGLENIYPKSHHSLAQAIIKNGALLSEFPLHYQANRFSFPRRNRIISGLSVALIVVEAALKSGSLISAQFALEQNREVFAIPGSIFSTQSRGCHKLIKEGASMAISLDDILFELDPILKKHLEIARNNLQAHPKHDKHVGLEQRNLEQYLGYFSNEAVSIDQLVKRSNLTVSEVSSMVLMLEMSNDIASAPGGFVRTKL